MTQTQRLVLWGSTAATGIALIGIALYFGLDKADKMASIFGAVIGTIALALGIFQILRSPASSTAAVPARQTQSSGDNSTNIQSAGNLTIGDNNKIGGSS
ncbi:hypothetical protein [Streptomyces sp. NPDC059491]|uniref:hypothetical protein n=1 Tax=unclassified Streptomyces TaxID=2593676 RepID=UPI00367CF8B9